MKTNQKGFSIVEIVLVLLVVGLIGTVGFMVYNNHKKSTNSSTSTSSTSPTTTQKTATNTQSTIPSDWTWYENKDAGFKFAYPKSWTLGTPTQPATTQNEVGFAISVAPPSPKEGDPTLGMDSYPATAHIYDVDKYNPSAKVADTKITTLTLGDKKDVTLAGTISEFSSAKSATTMYLTSCWERYCSPHLSNGRFFDATIGATTSGCEPHVACDSAAINTSSQYYQTTLDIIKTVTSL